MLAIVALSLSAVDPAPAQGTVTFESLLAEMADLDTLARFPSPEYAGKQASTYNRQSTARDQADQGTGGWFADSDGLGFIRTEQRNGQTEWVVMEHSGPGALTRFWTPFFYKDFGNRTGPKVRIYLDGAATPVIDQNLIELLTGLNWSVAEYGSKPSPQNSVSLPAPFSNFTARAGVLHFPVPFAQSCKITLSGGPFYDIVSYRAYPPGTAVETFTAAKFQSPLLATVGAALTHPPLSAEPQLQQSGVVPPNSGELALELPTGPRAVTELEIDLDEAAVAANPELLRNLVVSATFDGTETVWCPVGDFFNSADRINNVATLARVSTAVDGKFVCRWRLPYQTSGRVRLLNCGQSATTAALRVRTAAWAWDARSMHFHASWRPDFTSPGTPFHDWNFADVTGKGVLVGDVWTVLNLTNGWWGEGDEKIYVDDEYAVGKFPGNFGTGTEDYYGWAGGVVPTRTDEFNTPFESNCQVGSTATNSPRGFNICTRTRMLDAIPFHHRLVFDMEASPGTDQRNAWDLLMYSGVTFWYGLPGATSNRPPQPAKAAVPITSLAAMQAQSDAIRNGGGPTLPGAVEAEAIAPASASAGVLTTVVTPLPASDPAQVVSGGSYRLLQFTSAGQHVEFRLTEQFAARMVRVYLVTGPDAGTVDVWVNGKPVVSGINLQTPTLGRKELQLGRHEPAEAALLVRFVAGPGAGSRAVGVDAVVTTAPRPFGFNHLEWRLGEDDAGAAGGGALRASTAGAGSGGRVLTLLGTGGGSYSAQVPTGGSTLSAQLGGGQCYGRAGGGTLAGIDPRNLVLACDARPTASASFQIAMTLGSNNPADGATGGNVFVYHAGGKWHVHSNGNGNFDTGLPATLNAWHNLRLERVAGVIRLYVNGIASGPVVFSVAPAGPASFKDALSVGGNRNSSGAGFEGGFVGQIDNVTLTSGEPGYVAFVNAHLPPQVSAAAFPPGGDFDEDGASNLMEYLFGTDPAAGGSVPVSCIAAPPNASPRSITFQLNENARNAVYWEIEQSPDLAAWEVAARQSTHLGAVAIEPAAAPRGFARVVLPGGGLLAER